MSDKHETKAVQHMNQAAMNATFDHVRSVSEELQCFSWTTRDYQDDILNHLLENKETGFGIIEVGCFKGGLTALLASVCKEFDWPLYAIDVDETAIASTRKLLDKLDLLELATLHHGSLSSFAQETDLKAAPALVILDGDHRYEAVVDDIENVYRLNKRPHTAVFHDFSLRHPTSGEKVDQAVHDCFGDWPVRHIGARMDGDGTYPTKQKPSEDGHWWEIPGSEGAIVELPDQLKAPTAVNPPASSGLQHLFSRVLSRIKG